MGQDTVSVARKSAKFLLQRLKNAEDGEFQGLDVDSLVLKHIQVNKAPKMHHRTYRARAWVHPYASSLPAPLRWSLLRKNRSFLNQEVAQKKRLSQKKPELMAQE